MEFSRLHKIVIRYKSEKKIKSIQDFVKESGVSKDIYYKLRYDDSSMTCEQANSFAKALGISYHDFQVELGYESDNNNINDITVERARDIVYSNKQYFKEFGLEMYDLKDVDFLEIALSMLDYIELLSLKYKK